MKYIKRILNPKGKVTGFIVKIIKVIIVLFFALDLVRLGGMVKILIADSWLFY